MTTRPGPQRLGFGVALVGVVTFVAGCFLPFYGFGPQMQTEFTFSLYESTTSALTPDSSVVHYAGGILYLFSGAVLVGALSILGLRPGQRRWIAVALSAAAATWSLIWVGLLLSAAGADSLQFGYWVILAGIVIAVGGTALVIWSARHPDVPATEQTRAP